MFGNAPLVNPSQASLDWIRNQEHTHTVPIYGSVDIRDSGYKAAVVDTNLFPAGFNNLHPSTHHHAAQLIKRAILQKAPKAEHVLIIAEEHTRNKWYLQHLKTLSLILQDAGFEVQTATFLDPKIDTVCDGTGWVDLECADTTQIRLHCLHHYLNNVDAGTQPLDFVLFNNDLTLGLPERLKTLNIPHAPSPWVGWFNRSKSLHFEKANTWISQWATFHNEDPWKYSCLFSKSPMVSISNDQDRLLLADLASDLFKSIQTKFNEYGVSHSPILFLKANTGTYGMGVEAISSPQDILNLNRKSRNNLAKGKSGAPISTFLLQEGVPTRITLNGQVAEPCLYSIQNHVVGGFYRLNSLKSDCDNLNSQGMTFQPIETYPDLWPLYTGLAQLAGLAAGSEEKELIPC